MNRFCSGAVTGIVLTIFTFVLYNSNILCLDSESLSCTGQYLGDGIKFMSNQFEKFHNLTRKSKCNVDVVYNLATSGLKKI